MTRSELIKNLTGAAPEFEATDDFSRTMIRASYVPENNTPSPKTVHDGTRSGTIQGQLMSLLKANPHLTYEELAEDVGQTRKTVQRHLQSLKAKGLLRRIGGAKGGYWEVTHEGA